MQHISKSQIKLIRSLQQKKFRDQLGLFVAEGDKCINELRKAFELVLLVNSDNATPTEIQQMSSLRTPQGSIAVFKKKQGTEPATCNLSPATCNLSPATCNLQPVLTLALDGIQDPGNLGTIIRTADWFGVYHIVCSPDTADCYNPKVVQATMGSLARVQLHYTPLPQWLSNAGGAMTACSDNCAERDNGLPAITRSNHREAAIVQQPSCIVHCQPSTPIFGTLLDGQNMYEVLQQITGDRGQGTGDRISNAGGAMTACSDNCAERDNGLTAITRSNHREATIVQQLSRSNHREPSSPIIIIMGNEGNGISKEVREYITHPIRIPSYPSEAETSESLNVAIATAIVLAEFRRLEAK